LEVKVDQQYFEAQEAACPPPNERIAWDWCWGVGRIFLGILLLFLIVLCDFREEVGYKDCIIIVSIG
jgi:hypothetical protein